MSKHLGQEESENSFLVFRLGSEYYATPLLQVREVVEKQIPKQVPNTADSYLGVINIRGEIVGAIDLRIKFGQEPIRTETEALIVFETEHGVLAALADQLEGVYQISPSSIKPKPNIESNIPIDFIIAMANFKHHILTIIDLHKILTVDEITLNLKEHISTSQKLESGEKNHE